MLLIGLENGVESKPFISDEIKIGTKTNFFFKTVSATQSQLKSNQISIKSDSVSKQHKHVSKNYISKVQILSK